MNTGKIFMIYLGPLITQLGVYETTKNASEYIV
jgi:hypothetical protein